MPLRQSSTSLIPYTTLFRSDDHLIGEGGGEADGEGGQDRAAGGVRPVQLGDDIAQHVGEGEEEEAAVGDDLEAGPGDRKSTRLNSSHVAISYAVLSMRKKQP